MHLLIFITGIGKRFSQNLVLLYFTGFAFLVNFYKILVDYSSGSDVKMSHLGVSHLSFRQSDILPGGKQP